MFAGRNVPARYGFPWRALWLAALLCVLLVVSGCSYTVVESGSVMEIFGS